ncbi:cytochrome oxidase assembly protein, Sco1/SenC family [Luminiphilus syltensis NOR5-1B]|uniref:Cytochrome oxidase assembly protein, Sco1/SenC family n=2 Tax=Luminiphilus TaxID=1341118 RepID=B8KUJ1_9GAMM|nr:cytochrome oxidase assembly protein, Sco1/SenC family [Luminiphilus syltensis NOR5-1B]
MVLLLIAGIPVIMVLSASWLWYFVVEGNLDLVGSLGTSNNGTLVEPPRQINTVTFRDDAGGAFVWTDLEPRWTLLVANGPQTCDARCEKRLYTVRQIHIALGKNFNRVRRVFVGATELATIQVAIDQGVSGRRAEVSDGPLLTYMAAAHQGLVPLSTSEETFAELFPELDDNAAQWYLVDPAGWIMMRFDDQLDYKAVISDLKFLLKNSGD